MAKACLQKELERRYKPVPHTGEDDARLFADPQFKAAFGALEEEFTALEAFLSAREEAGLTQAQIAERMGTTASAVARLEASLVSGKHSPSVATLRKYAKACGKTLKIALE
jgi:DNA-binding XRE family transcriptional regulator